MSRCICATAALLFILCVPAWGNNLESVETCDAIVLWDGEANAHHTAWIEGVMKELALPLPGDTYDPKTHARLVWQIVCWETTTLNDLDGGRSCVVDVDVLRVANLYPGSFGLVSVWSAMGVDVPAARVKRKMREILKTFVHDMRQEEPDA